MTRANGLLFTSRVVLAGEALTVGLVNAVVPPAELLPYTYTYVRTLITNVSPEFRFIRTCIPMSAPLWLMLQHYWSAWQPSLILSKVSAFLQKPPLRWAKKK